MYTHLLLISTIQFPRAYCSFSIIIYLLYQNKCFCDFLWIWADMLECAIHPITYRGEGILATVVKIWFPAYIQPWKHFFGITAFTMIGGQHICSLWFSKPAWSAVTDISFCCIKYAVCIFQPSGFIHIYRRIQCHLKCTAIRIYKSPHSLHPTIKNSFTLPKFLIK